MNHAAIFYLKPGGEINLLRITVDNNFFNQNILKNNDVIKYFENKKVLFYPSLELIGEFLSIRSNKLKLFSELFLRMRGQGIINSWQGLLLNDVGIKQVSWCIDSSLETAIRKILYKLSQGEGLVQNEKEIVEKIKQEVKCGKVKMGNRYNEAKDLYGVQNKYKDFEDFYNKNGGKIRQIIFKKIFKDNNISIKENDIIEKENYLNNKQYFKLYARIHGAFIYYHYINNQNRQKINGSDFYDHLYLVYLAGVDYLITNDKRLITIGKLIFPKENRLIKPDSIKKIFETRNFS